MLKFWKREKRRTVFTKDYRRFLKYDIGDYTYGYPKLLFQNSEAKLVIGKYCSISEEVQILLGGMTCTPKTISFKSRVFRLK